MNQSNQNDDSDNHPSQYQNLYVRRKQTVKGPYPRGLVRNFLLIGRLKLSDEVSGDKEHWIRIKDDESLIPKEMLNVKTKDDKDRLKRAQRRQDERARERRRQGAILSEKDRRARDRRQNEEDDFLKHREQINDISKAYNKNQRKIIPIFMFLVIMSGLAYLSYIVFREGPPIDTVTIDCNAAPAPKVNWSNCNMNGRRANSSNLSQALMQNINLQHADLHGANLSFAKLNYAKLDLSNLSYADLSNAELIGASLRGADLTNANLIKADLSYVNLKDAKLGGAQLKGAKLDRAIWFDGVICKQGSIGVCLR